MVIRKLLTFFVTLTLLCSCANVAQNSEEQTSLFVDDYGREVEVPTHPRRVVSLSPAVTEIIFALGADSLLVGRTEYCTYPPEASSIKNIGGISNMNIEMVLSVEPDLVISGSMVPQKLVDRLSEMGVPLVCVIEKQHFDALYDNIKRIGGLIGCSDKADSLNNSLRAELQSVNICSMDKTSKGNAPSVYYVVGYGSDGNFTAGGNTFINDIIAMAGGYNIAAGAKGWTFSVEALMEADPDFILIRAEDSASFCNTAPYSRLSAVKSGRLVSLEDGILDLQVPRNIEVVKLLKAKFKGK